MQERTNGGAQPADGPHDVGERAVRDVMSVALVTLAEDESVLMAWEILQRTGFHHLPVVDESGHCLGLVERSDLAVACAMPAAVLGERDVGSLVAEQGPVLVRAEDPVSRAAEVMTDAGVDAAAVVGVSEEFVGLVTARDLVSLLAGRSRRRVSPAGSGPLVFSLEPVLPYPFDE
ncbi:CBS domain-containing protein [Yinghuangia sp. ASG 101]|uniref:CBS domain-containing protein n=1 Tax=Yinghuangia sp. ASG 101 TaxID=2896848 RepID=UPI001E5F7582|nr:CBS domain-containing protein [Yinghuangia sp. ASG 101]UGQ11514.1 CBS domain-containing protein [Yinghuangia sp. ASG 101]